ncbi:YbjN domain-containing protein [Desulfosporosinus sp. Sb-LF]|uniref:YbjN domain-containing protein n=1 Tax=Desulfosporosinus sp. Sb-LF TaxID=2560027 RepID=UPI00107FC483|nr:YbjN domain-containing protein [Desulfosporosinus sp. Sb-LF]TGE31139.1 YbjN domain-containing protein [Desulfosporosinus sp. Sb-LF]
MSLFRMLYEILNQNGWDFDFDNKNEIIKLDINGVNTNFHAFLLVDEEQESLLCNTHIDQKIPHSKRLEVCDFMSRVNYELANGNFEMDMDNGEIRYRTFLDLADAVPSKDQVLNILWNGVLGFDTFYPGLMKLVYGNCSAEEAASFCTEEDT